jgi:hypothetical protein
MSLLTREEVKTLARNNQAGPCVSIFMPTHRAGPETQQDPIRFKNLVSEAEERLIAGGLRAPRAKALLKAANALVDDYDFWQHQRAVLALFFRLTCFELIVCLSNSRKCWR